jgi:hypothetical protein
LAIIDLNLYILNNLPSLPTLGGVSAKTGPGVSSLINIAVINEIGKNIINKITERIISIVLLQKK